MKELNSKKNFLGLDKKNSSYEESQIIIIPVTFNKKYIDKSISSILKYSRFIGEYDEEQKRDISLERGICTLETLKLFPSEKSLVIVEREINRHIQDGIFTVILGSEKIISLPSFLAHQKKYENLSLVCFSAFASINNLDKNKRDTNSLLTKLSDYASDVVLIGTRSISKEEINVKNNRNIKIFFTREIRLGMYGDNWQEIAVKNLKENVFIIFDLSVFDPSLINSINSEPGGLFWDEIMNLLKIIGLDKNIVSLCITGFHSSKCTSKDSYLIAKLIYKIANYKFS